MTARRDEHSEESMTKNSKRWMRITALVWAAVAVVTTLLAVRYCKPEKKDDIMSGELRDGCNSLCLESRTESYPFDHEHCIWSCIANSITDPKE